MPQFRVRLNINGVLRVEAEDEEHAKEMAQEAPALIAGCKLFGENREAKVEGPVENHSLDPDDVSQEFDIGDA